MKNSFQKSLASLIVLGFVLSTTFIVNADQHHTETITNKVREFYAQMRAGNFQEAFDHIKLGGTGYLPIGLLREIPTEEVKSEIVNLYETAYENGLRLNFYPKHIQVKEYGNIAIATYYVDSMSISAESDEENFNVMTRATLVWLNENDDWKIIHWHVSDLERDRR